MSKRIFPPAKVMVDSITVMLAACTCSHAARDAERNGDFKNAWGDYDNAANLWAAYGNADLAESYKRTATILRAKAVASLGYCRWFNTTMHAYISIHILIEALHYIIASLKQCITNSLHH